MQNMTMKQEGTKLIITVDLAKNAGASKTGKSIIVATSSGNIDVPGHAGMKLGLNVYKPAEQS
jgi:hypothetical protein